MFQQGNFIEVYVKCLIDECERRDPKGLYKKARIGKIKDFTEISAPYEEPANPEIILETGRLSIDETVDIIIDYMSKHNYIGIG